MPEAVGIIEDPEPQILQVDDDLPTAEIVSINNDPPRTAFQKAALSHIERIKEEEKAPGTALGRTGKSLIGSMLGSIANPIVDMLKGAETSPEEGEKPVINRVGDAALAAASTIPVNQAFVAGSSLLGSGIREAAVATGTPYPEAEARGEEAQAAADTAALAAFAAQGMGGLLRKKAPGSIPVSQDAPGMNRTPVVDPETGATILKNPKAPEPLSDEYLNVLKAKGVDINEPQAIGKHVAEREGLPVPVEVEVVPEMPISKTELDGAGLKVQLEPGTPAEVASRVEHEVAGHGPEKTGMAPPPIEDNAFLTAEGIRKERAYPEVEPGNGDPGPHLPKDVNPALESLRKARAGAEDMSTRESIAFHQSETIAETGTIKKDLRLRFREKGPKPETKGLRISEGDVENYGLELVQSARALREAYRNPNLQDPMSQMGIKMAMDSLGDATDIWTAMRFGGGRTVGRFGKALDKAMEGMQPSESREVSELLRTAGVSLEGSQILRQALWTEGWRSIAKGDALKGTTDLVSFASMNLFSALSFSVDVLTSVYRQGGQAGGYLARDLVWMAKGHPNFPNFGAFARALKRGKLPDYMKPELGGAVAGELAPGEIPFKQIGRDIKSGYEAGGIKGALSTPIELGEGTATHRQGFGTGIVKDVTGLVSAIFDEATMAPAYAKRMVDTASGHIGAGVKLSAMADEAANLKGLKGAERDAFIKEFYENLRGMTESQAEVSPEMNEALRVGHELQWKMPLSEIETKLYTGPQGAFYRLFFSVFPNWSSQFVRGMADMLGVRPATWKRIAASSKEQRPFEIAEMLGRAGTGWGSIYFANQFYEAIDFDSMEMVVPPFVAEHVPSFMRGSSPGRLRLGSMDPLPEIFGLLAVMRGDKAKAAAALKHGSIPFVSAFAKAGGILTPVVRQIQTFAEKGDFNVARAQQEMTDLVNSLIPAQAVMGVFKSLLDPVARHGVGAGVPVVSKDLPAKIDTTTGEEQVPQQRIGDIHFRNVQGAPIRGAIRDTDAVFELLDYYVPEAIIRSGVRTPYAGIDLGDIPPEQQDEYKKMFGKYRWQFLTMKKYGSLAGMFAAGKLAQKGTPGYEKVRMKVQALDSAAASSANAMMRKKYGANKPGRKETIRESSGAGWTYKPQELPPEPDPEIIEDSETQ